MKNIFKSIGPGIVVAATGIGAGDMIAATLGGAKYGYVILWAVVLGGVLKYVLNEGIGRWQIISGTSIITAWKIHLPKIFSMVFLVYFLLWSVIVSAALIAATGLAAYSLTGVFSVTIWGIIHSFVALAIILFGNYLRFESIMKVIIAMMFVVVIVSSLLIKPDFYEILKSIAIPILPEGGVKYSLAIIGGVGGSVTLLSYGYWINEKGWKGKSYKNRIKIDLAIAYVLTTLFGISIVIIAADLKPSIVSGSQIVVGLADRMKESTGEIGKWIFLIGFWGAVFSSMLGVWQGVPYIFADFINNFRISKQEEKEENLSKTNYYKWFLISLAILPIALLIVGKPVWLIMVYSVAGSLFMPFLALSLLILNNKISILKEDKNNIIINLFLVINLVLFLYLGIIEILNY